MAWHFTLSAECGAERAGAERFRQHFDGWQIALPTGSPIRCAGALDPQDYQGNWWADAIPEGLRYPDGLRDAKGQREEAMIRIGAALYDRLRTAPLFRYAIVGWEVEQFRTYDELLREEAAELPRLRGLTVNEDIWSKLGRPPIFTNFSSGYVWVPYDHHTWMPNDTRGGV